MDCSLGSVATHYSPVERGEEPVARVRDEVMMSQSLRVFPIGDPLVQCMEDRLVRWHPPALAHGAGLVERGLHPYQTVSTVAVPVDVSRTPVYSSPVPSQSPGSNITTINTRRFRRWEVASTSLAPGTGLAPSTSQEPTPIAVPYDEKEPAGGWSAWFCC